MKLFNRFRNRLFGLAAVALLGGCVSTGETMETKFYLLSTLPSGSESLTGANADPPLTVYLTGLAIPQYLQRPEIVTRVDQNRLVLAEFDNWGGSLEKNMARVLAGNLSVLLDTPEVHVTTRRPPRGIDASVEIEIMQFERGPDAHAVLDAQWRLHTSGRDKAPSVSMISRFVSEPVTNEVGMAATVAAMSELLAQLSTAIAQAIVEHSRR